MSSTKEMLALIQALKSARAASMDLERIGMWGQSMGAASALGAMVLSEDVRAYVLFAPVSAGAEDNFYMFSPEEIALLRQTYGPPGAEMYWRIAPLTYFADVASPVQLHHGEADTAVPILFSEKIFSALTRLGKRAEFYRYPGEKHKFADSWPLAAERALQFFDRYVKEAL